MNVSGDIISQRNGKVLRLAEKTQFSQKKTCKEKKRIIRTQPKKKIMYLEKKRRKTMAFQYPNEVFVAQRKDQTFMVDSHMSRATAREDGNNRPAPPLTVFSRFSRFTFVLINTTKSTKSVIANVPVRSIREISALSDYAHKKHLDERFSGGSGSGAGQQASGPAYTVKMTSGYFKGRTPAEVLLENPGNAQSLENQIGFLSGNLQRYPRNQEQINAIQHALSLLSQGALNGNLVKHTQEIILYEASLRPLKSRQAHGNCWFIYDVRVSWLVGEDSPVRIRISNYYAPVEQKPDGTYNVMAKNREQGTDTTNEMTLTVKEWMDCLESMSDNKLQFVVNNAGACYEEWTQLVEEGRQQAKDSQQGQAAQPPYQQSPYPQNQYYSQPAPQYNEQGYGQSAGAAPSSGQGYSSQGYPAANRPITQNTNSQYGYNYQYR